GGSGAGGGSARRDPAHIGAGRIEPFYNAGVVVDAKATDRVGDAGLHPNSDARSARRREREVVGIGSRRGALHALRDVFIRQRGVVEQVPGASAGLLGGRLHEVVLRPGDVALEELLPALVEDAGDAAVQLSERNELLLREVRVGHVAAGELAEAGGQPGTARERMTKAVAGAPRIRAQAQLAAGMDALADEL